MVTQLAMELRLTLLLVLQLKENASGIPPFLC